MKTRKVELIRLLISKELANRMDGKEVDWTQVASEAFHRACDRDDPPTDMDRLQRAWRETDSEVRRAFLHWATHEDNWS